MPLKLVNHLNCTFDGISSSSSCHTVSTDLPVPFSALVPIVYHSQQVFQVTSCIGTELLSVGSSWSTYLCLSMWRGTSLMSSSFLLQQYPTCLVHLIWMIFVMGGRWPLLFCGGLPSRNCSIQHAAFLCNCRQAFSSYV